MDERAENILSPCNFSHRLNFPRLPWCNELSGAVVHNRRITSGFYFPMKFKMRESVCAQNIATDELGVYHFPGLFAVKQGRGETSSSLMSNIYAETAPPEVFLNIFFTQLVICLQCCKFKWCSKMPLAVSVVWVGEAAHHICRSENGNWFSKTL